MPRTKTPGRAAAFLPLTLETARGAEPLHRQLYDQLRGQVLAGHLAQGARLPASRGLARELGCSRNTVLSAYDQLLSEGYLEGAQGSGTYVAPVLPDRFLTLGEDAADRLATKRPGAVPGSPAPSAPARLSRRGRALADLRRRSVSGGADSPAVATPVPGRGGHAFEPGVPDVARFPFAVWGRLLGRTWRRPPSGLTRQGDPAGYRPLRQAIAAHLRGARGLACDWRQVLITSGAQQALDLVVRALLDPSEAAWCEDPGYPGLRGPLIAAGARIVPVPLDAEGLSVSLGRALAPEARLAVVAPSHQFPLGVVMSLARRLELLEWARTAKTWILEDDYDSEYRYAGRPLAALQGLGAARDGGAGRVIYLGTFSKVMFPSLRIGYLVVPEALIEPLTRVRATLDDHPSAVVQPALANFIDEGHFAGHVRRMRALYATRQGALIEAARRHLDGLLALAPDEAGMHLVARLSPSLAARLSDRQAEARALSAGIKVSALSDYAIVTPSDPSLMLGYAAVPEDEIEGAARVLARALES